MLAVCLPPMEAGLRMGWEESGQCGRRGVSAMGKGEVVREKAMLLPILRRMHMMRCVALVPLHTLECSEKHTGLSECISGALGSAFLLRRKPKSAKAAACRLVINIIGISQQSAETVEAGWAYQRLDGIVEFDQQSPSGCLAQSCSSSPPSRRRQGVQDSASCPCCQLHVSVGLMASEGICKCPR